MFSVARREARQNAESEVVARFMDLVDTETLTRLNVDLDDDGQLVTDWISVLFSRRQGHNRVRPYPRVEDFSLKIVGLVS